MRVKKAAKVPNGALVGRYCAFGRLQFMMHVLAQSQDRPAEREPPFGRIDRNHKRPGRSNRSDHTGQCNYLAVVSFVRPLSKHAIEPVRCCR